MPVLTWSRDMVGTLGAALLDWAVSWAIRPAEVASRSAAAKQRTTSFIAPPGRRKWHLAVCRKIVAATLSMGRRLTKMVSTWMKAIRATPHAFRMSGLNASILAKRLVFNTHDVAL
jgi:hypothetical protein